MKVFKCIEDSIEYDFRAPGYDTLMCGNHPNGELCTRPKGHYGPHVRHTHFNRDSSETCRWLCGRAALYVHELSRLRLKVREMSTPKLLG